MHDTPRTGVACLALHALGIADGQELTTDEIAEAVDRPRRSVARAMTALQTIGLVVRYSKRGAWRLGRHRCLASAVHAAIGSCPTTVAALARQLRVSCPAVRGALRHLEAQGEVTRLTTVGPWRLREPGDGPPTEAPWWQEDRDSRRWYPRPRGEGFK